MDNKNTTAIEFYIKQGWQPVLLQPNSKQPPINEKGWEKKTYTVDDFNDDSNVGLMAGKRSGGLTVVDNDCSEARALAGLILPPTPMMSSRHPQSAHYWYYGGKNANRKVRFELRDPDTIKRLGLGAGTDDKAVIVEVLASGQVMVPPSIHPSGQKVEWVGGVKVPPDPAAVDFDELLRYAGLLAFSAVVARAYPRTNGSRDEICMALAGTLLKAGMPEHQVDLVLERIAKLADDEESHKRNKAAATKAKQDENEATTGFNQLIELLGLEAEAKNLRKWIFPQAEHEELLQQMNEQHIVVGSGNCVVVEEILTDTGRWDLKAQSFESFKKRFMNERVEVPGETGTRQVAKGQWWLEHPRRRQVDRIGFKPKGELEYISSEGRRVYNLWRDFGVKTVEGKLHESFLAHLKNIICSGNEDHYNYLIRWMANAIQHPDRPGQVAVAMRGPQGTGKSFFATHFGKLFGRHYLHVSNSEHITGRFNKHIHGTIFMFADECFYAGNRKHENLLKHLVTEDELIIEAKGVDAEPAANYLHLIMATNNKWVVPAVNSERRYFVLDVSPEWEVTPDTPLEQRREKDKYFDGIERDLKDGGYESLLWFLLNMHLTGFEVRNMPFTSALNAQVAETVLDRNPDLEKIVQFLNNGGPLPGGCWKDKDGHLCVLAKDLYEELGVDSTVLGTELKNAGVRSPRQVAPSVDPKRPRYYTFHEDLETMRRKWFGARPELRSLRKDEVDELQHDEEDLPF